MDMTSQILPFFYREFSAVVETTGHFFSGTARKEVVRNTKQHLSKCLVSLLMIISITSLYLVHIQLHQLITSLLIDIKS